jgi:uncharacterized protein
MRNLVGSPARNSNFFPREADIRELWHQLTRGHVLMLAPRRVGKTSLLYHLQDEPRAGWHCLYLSVEGAVTEAEFVARLLAVLCQAHPTHAWRTRFGAGLRRILRSFGSLQAGPFRVKLADAIGEEWQTVGLTALAVMGETQGDTVVMVDEFPIFVQHLLTRKPDGEERARFFLDWFREARHAKDRDGRMHFLLTGSLGLDAVLRAAGMTATINDFATFQLAPLTPIQADAFLARLGEGEELALTAEIRRRILRHIDWPIPFHLQLLFSEILRQVKFRDRVLDEALVDGAYATLLAPSNRMHFEHWVQRLDKPVLSPEEWAFKMALLRAAALDRDGVTESSIIQIGRTFAPGLKSEVVLASLEHDGYLVSNGQRWRFASTLLRDWWRKWQTLEDGT